VTSYYRRYLDGEHAIVWAELRALGPVPEQLAEEVGAVAAETMRRVARHVVRIADALPGLGFVAEGTLAPHQPATAEDRVTVDALAARIGGLPAAFAACLREVGSVSFLGDCGALGLAYHGPGAPAGMPPGPGHPDPLCLPDAGYLLMEWEKYEEREDQDGFSFCLAPDELHKANISGGTHDLRLPDTRADPGFPGWAFAPQRVPAALAGLRAAPRV
jgi:hypothetical protein